MKACVAVFLLFANCAAAQKSEVALTLGGYFTRHVHVISDNMFAIEGNVAHEVLARNNLSLSIEASIVASLSARAKGLLITRGQVFGTRNYSAFFLSPGLRLKLFRASRLSPFFATGFGLAHFSKTGITTDTSTNVLNFGGGVDWNISHHWAVRGEARDFYSGPPQLITGLKDREHQILATGGIVLKF